MDLDAILRPRGPMPAAVYWRRRLVLLTGVVLLVVLVGRITGGGAGDVVAGPSRSPSPSPSATPPPSASPSPSARPSPSRSPSPSPAAARSPGAPCRTQDLKVAATSNATNYPAGVRPVLAVTVTNVSQVACTRDLGQAAREIRVVSGNDRIWSSDDCAPGGSAAPTLISAGETKSFSVTWSRRRSAPGCPAVRTEAAPGTYQVIGRIGDITARGAAFQLQ